ncbi:MAG TPA: PPK2 family polyphosphate kinase [Chthonomonadaceae bacterium]|nr:PPK2 family polyphosphate kinase [Chthonomonadaceae bacterium]
MSLLKRLDGSKPIRLKDYNPAEDGGLDRPKAEALSAKYCMELEELQDLLYAAQETPVLIVLQGLDTAGKDGTIRHVLAAMNPQSCRVASFKVPTPVEAAHDFLWRIHAETPGKGNVAIFNRSHYEDVLVVRVHNLVPPDVWKDRYDDINHFEGLLADNGAIILKFFLYISNEEQEQRLRDREKDPTKAWKLSAADWKERDFWDAYLAAYEDALNKCAKPHAPWYVVPANHKWFRNAAIAETLVETLRPFRDKWMKRLEEIGAEELKQLRAMRQHH